MRALYIADYFGQQFHKVKILCQILTLNVHVLQINY